MRILLDSHAVVWWLSEPKRLLPVARAAIEDPGNEIYVSAATIWELGLKAAKGKLTLPVGYDEALWSGGIEALAVTASHAVAAMELPPFHHDPFDRMLMAQAVREGLMLMTRDQMIRRYPVPQMIC